VIIDKMNGYTMREWCFWWKFSVSYFVSIGFIKREES
jgi:hypothetical protein